LGMLKMIDWEILHKLIADAKRILLTTHENPDGDGLGCASAMLHYLNGLKLDTRIVCATELPKEYAFLSYAESVECYEPQIHDEWLATVDLVLVFDIGDFRRLRDIGQQILTNNIPSINIDHHVQTNNSQFNYNFIDLEAAATGEMLYDFFKPIYPDSLPLPIAEGLYTAIINDTGSFRYSNTTERCHEVAIECIRVGIKPHKIYQNIYESNSIPRIKLLGLILNTVQFDFNGELAWFKIDQNMMIQCAAENSDVDGFTDYIRTIRGVEVAVMLYQNGANTCRINFRSKGKYNIQTVAQEMGGGGHPFAAGAVIDGNLDSVAHKVLQATINSLQSQNNPQDA